MNNIQRLINQLQGLIDEGKNKPTDKVLFRHNIISSDKYDSEVCYILYAETKDAVTLCYDDGEGH